MRKLLLFLAVLGVAYWGYINFFIEKELQAVPVERVVDEPSADPVIEGMEARLYLNSLRQKGGLPSFYGNESLEKAAALHASYLAKNRTDGHYQVPELPGFSGKTPADRAVKAGYPSRMVQENLSSGNIDFKDSVDGLFSAIYHRFGFLDSVMDEIGIAYAEDVFGRRIYVYDMGNYNVARLCREEERFTQGRYITGICTQSDKKISSRRFEKVLDTNRKQSKDIILWPYDGQEDVPPAFFEEIPDPLPDYSVSGYPISIVFNDLYFKRVKVVSFRLYSDVSGEEVPVRLMDSGNDPNLLLKKNQFAIFPLERLDYDTNYTAVVNFTAGPKSFEREWHFRTRSFDADILKVASESAEFKIEAGKSYVLYLQPHGPNDLLKDVVHPRGTVVERIDANTFMLKVAEGMSGPVVIKAGERRVRLDISGSPDQ